MTAGVRGMLLIRPFASRCPRMIVVALLALFLAAPATAGEDPSATASSPGSQYRIGAGDTLQVQVYGEESLSGPFPVNDGGALDFPLLGPIEVAGLTALEAAELLRARLGDGFIVEPNVTAWLDSYQSQPVQVLGAVAKPGLYYLKGSTTVLEILSEAGGASIEGVNEVRITRGGEEGDVTVVPYDHLLGRGEGNLELKGGDIVFVPESLVTVMGQVNKPGDISLRDDLTVSDCIAAAGGAHETANLGRVWILRGDERIRVNVRKVLAGKAEDVRVQAGDRVFVGESAF